MQQCKECGHMPWVHAWSTYPKPHRPCTVCVKCGGNGRSCCLTPKPCTCRDYKQAVA